MRTSEEGVNLIKSFEGFSHRAYKCPAGVWTVGYGSTGPHVKSNTLVTTAEATELLKKDLEKFEKCINGAVKVGLLQCQFDALVSFVYNVGPGSFLTSTLLKYLNQGNMLEASNQFLRWTLAGGKRLPGLLTRRTKERALFLRDMKL